MSEKEVGTQAAELYKDYKDNIDDPELTEQNLEQAREFVSENLDELKTDALLEYAAQTGKEIIGLADGMADNVTIVDQENEGTEEIDDQYDAKVDYLVARLRPQFQEAVLAEQERVIGLVGGEREAARTNIWEALKKGEHGTTRKELQELLRSAVGDIPKNAEDRDVFDRVMAGLSIQSLGVDTIPGASQFWDGKNMYLTYPKDINSTTDREGLYDLVDSDELKDPTKIEKAEVTIKALILSGAYRFYGDNWANSDLQDAIKLLEAYTKNVPSFNPLKAGYVDADNHTITMAAAIGADDATKPNWEAAKPERRAIRVQIRDNLARLCAVRAHEFLRDKDFDLPDTEE